MYSVIGSDGQTYGPADFDTLKAWCQEGRIHADTRIIDPIDGMTKPAHDLPEVAQHIRPPSAPRVAQPVFQPSYFSVPAVSYPRDLAYASSPPKSKLAAILLGFFLGPLGIHRFYLGHVGTGIAMLLITVISGGTLAAITGIWAVIDMVLIATGSLRDSNGRPLRWP